MAEFNLTAKQIKSNYDRFRDIVNVNFPTRRIQLNTMYDAMEERVMFAPASTYEHFHNAIPGGYVDHVLRVYDFTMAQYELWKNMGMKVDNFTMEELQFAAIHHDLGKLGLPGTNGERWQPNDSDWHRKNQGKLYKVNSAMPFVNTSDVTFYLLNYYNISFSLNEMLGIKLTDGLYDEVSKPYFINYDTGGKLRNDMPYILHHSELMASRFEFERWATTNNKFVFSNNVSGNGIVPERVANTSTPETDLFDKLFGQ